MEPLKLLHLPSGSDGLQRSGKFEISKSWLSVIQFWQILDRWVDLNGKRGSWPADYIWDSPKANISKNELVWNIIRICFVFHFQKFHHGFSKRPSLKLIDQKMYKNQEVISYLSGTFDYVLDHRVKIEIQTRLPYISIPYSARITKKFWE